MIVTTTEQVEGKRITEVWGIVQGIGYKRGGKDAETAVGTAYSLAVGDMEANAPEGCDAIVGTRISVASPWMPSLRFSSTARRLSWRTPSQTPSPPPPTLRPSGRTAGS